MACRNVVSFDVDTKMAPLSEGGREGRRHRKPLRAIVPEIDACSMRRRTCVLKALESALSLFLLLFLSSVSFIRSRPSPSSRKARWKWPPYTIRPWFKCLQREDKNHGRQAGGVRFFNSRAGGTTHDTGERCSFFLHTAGNSGFLAARRRRPARLLRLKLISRSERYTSDKTVF